MHRRKFLQTASALAGMATLPLRGRVLGSSSPSILVPMHGQQAEPDLHALAALAVDAARSAGATYADVRLTLTRQQRFFGGGSSMLETLDTDVGVRALVNGYWGFLSSATWTPDEMARLGRGAVAQAKASNLGVKQDVDMGTVPRVDNGKWIMPVKYDPFDIPVGEKIDFIQDAVDFGSTRMNALSPAWRMWFVRQRKVFASTENSSWDQTTYQTSGSFVVYYRDQYSLQLPEGAAAADFLSPAGKGWEHISESGLIDAIPQLLDEAEQSRHQVPVDVGVYDVVLSAQAMAALIGSTIGTATELDRAMGYEADATGTSYLDDPLTMLGTYKMGSPLLNVTGDRSTVGGLATVKWDDEAVVPDTFPIVRDGVLVDFQTIREQADWLAPYYHKINHPVRSHGCAGADSARRVTMQRIPNLQVIPSPHATSFDDLVADTKRGIAVLDADPGTDQQQMTGVAIGTMRHIKDGKLGPFLKKSAIMFKSSDLWKNLAAIGGKDSQHWYGNSEVKGQPEQETRFSVGAVPAKVTDAKIIDPTRKA